MARWGNAASPEALAAASVTMVAAGFLAIALLHVLEPHDPRTTYLSDLEASPDHGWLMRFSYTTIGPGAILLALAVRPRAAGGRSLRMASALLGVAGASIVAFAVFPQGMVHLNLVRVGQGVLLTGVGFFAVGVRERHRWRVFETISWTIVTIAVLGLLRAEQLFPWPGLLQRGFFALVLAWFFLAARAAFPTTAERAAA